MRYFVAIVVDLFVVSTTLRNTLSLPAKMPIVMDKPFSGRTLTFILLLPVASKRRYFIYTAHTKS